MAVTYQEINESLARGNASSNNEIKKADQYLTAGKGEKPDWLEGFFESNKSKLTETILRAISSAEGITSLSGYNEGYFNEIIQNANDLHVGESIEFNVSKDENKNSVECIYSDKGFKLSNIYGFLNREMSDKSSEEGQTGKFGVGIKSFFKFVTRFRIESNVIFDFSIDRENSNVDGKVCINDKWNKESTTLYFEYIENGTSDNGFNTGKLSDLIEYLEGDSDDDIPRFFINGKDDELLFDFRSLIFMNKGSNIKSISKMSFSGTYHNVSVVCEDVCALQEFEKWNIRNVKLNVSVDDNEYSNSEYLLFTNGKNTLGFPLENDLDDYNRIYSTYYIKCDESKNILPLSMIIDTASANIHRNDLGDNEKSINEAYKNIKDKLIELYWFMCSPEITESECIDKISDIFHSVLYRYFGEDREESPFKIEALDNQYLPKTSGNAGKDVVFHEKVENYQKSTVLDQHLTADLTRTYYALIEKENVIDYNELTDSPECINGVRDIYEYIHSCDGKNEDYESAIRILHYFPKVAEYITYIISGERRKEAYLSDAEIDRWLYHIENEMPDRYNQHILLKLVGRYGLNPALAFDGTLKAENLSFKDYIFNGLPELKNGYMTNWQNKQYDSQYSELKEQMLGNRLYDSGNKKNQYNIRFIEPCSYSRRRWDGCYDCYQLPYRKDHFVSENNKLVLLEKIASDGRLRSCIDGQNRYLFEKVPINWRCRDKHFEYRYSDYEQQIIRLEFLKNIKLNDFSKFLKAIQYKKMIKACGRILSINITCYQSSITTSDIINSFLPDIVSINEENGKKSYLLSEYKPNDVIIDNIEINTNNELPEENRNFIEKISGYRVFLSKFDSRSKKYMIAYFGNRNAKIKTSAGTGFKPVASFSSSSRNIYIFYDNVPDINSVVSTVLKDLNISQNLMELLTGYIHNGNNTKTMNYLSRRRTFARIKKKLILDWADITEDDVSETENIEILYRLLTARGSYDIYCPICSDIPLETFDYGEDTKKKHSRKIIVMENENHATKQQFPYIITVGCSYCFEKLRNTLSKSEFDGKNITLTTQIAQGQHEKMKSRHQIELSPINIEIMRSYKLDKQENVNNNHLLDDEIQKELFEIIKRLRN